MPPEESEFFASCFGEFIARLHENPVSLLNEVLGGYTRYFDGKTQNQWVPERYVPDVRGL